MGRPLVLEIPMPYPGGCISKNRLWRRGDRRQGLNKEARAWKADLENAVRLILIGYRVASVRAVVGRISGEFADRNHAPDLHNLTELVADAVEAATGVNDREHTWSTGEARYGVQVPRIVIRLELQVERQGDDAQV